MSSVERTLKDVIVAIDDRIRQLNANLGIVDTLNARLQELERIKLLVETQIREHATGGAPRARSDDIVPARTPRDDGIAGWATAPDVKHNPNGGCYNCASRDSCSLRDLERPDDDDYDDDDDDDGYEDDVVDSCESCDGDCDECPEGAMLGFGEPAREEDNEITGFRL